MSLFSRIAFTITFVVGFFFQLFTSGIPASEQTQATTDALQPLTHVLGVLFNYSLSAVGLAIMVVLGLKILRVIFEAVFGQNDKGQGGHNVQN